MIKLAELEQITDEQLMHNSNVSLQEKLEGKTTFDFHFAHNQKKLIRNGTILIAFSTVIGALLGAFIFLLLKDSTIANDYAILGIGAGFGAASGLLLGAVLLTGLRTNIVEEFGAGYGAGIGTNISIGSVLGVLFGAGIGTIFGLILERINYDLVDPMFGYILDGILVWMLLGLNIGVLIGIITSFTFIGIILGGMFSGAVVGIIGMLTIYGPDITLLYGGLIGILGGGLIGLLAKYSIKASFGMENSLQWTCGKRVLDRQTFRRRRTICGSGGGGYVRYCDCDSCILSRNIGCNAGLASNIILIIAIPVVLIVTALTWLSVQASFKFGKGIKRGSLTAIGVSTSVFLIIGSNISMSTTFHSLEIFHVIAMGAGFGLIFGSFFLLALWLSIKTHDLEISADRIFWKDPSSVGEVAISDIEEFYFVNESALTEQPNSRAEDYFRFITEDGKSFKIKLNSWKTPENTSSFDYIRSILLYYIELDKKSRVTIKEVGKEKAEQLTDD